MEAGLEFEDGLETLSLLKTEDYCKKARELS